MFRAAAAIVGQPDAEDVTQQALVDAWRGFDRLRDRSRVRSWLHAIVANRARKQIRAWRSRPRLIWVRPEPGLESERSTPSPELQIAQRDQLDRAFDRLPLDQRICLALRYSVDLSVAQIAAAMGVPEGTVKSRIHAGLAQLRVVIGKPGSTEPLRH